MEQATAMTDNGKLLLTKERAIQMKKSEESPSNHGGDGKRHGKASSEKKKKKVDPNACRLSGKMGHWAKECPNRKQKKKAEAHLAQADGDNEATLLMVTSHVGELCDSCLAGKQRRLPFPKAPKYRAVDALELVHSDLYAIHKRWLVVLSPTHG